MLPAPETWGCRTARLHLGRCVLAFATALTATRSARANPSARLVYARSRSANSCPDESILRKAVATRFGYDPFFAWAKQTVVVQLWRDAERFRARVQLVDGNGTERGVRELSSQQRECSELFDATALAISIALDLPEPQTDVPPSRQPELPLAPTPPTTESKPAGRGSLETAGPPVETDAPSTGWTLGVDSLVTGNTAPALAPGLSVFGIISWRALSLGFESLATLSVPASLPTGGHGTVHSSVVAAAVVPCFSLGPAFACPVGQLGVLVAWGRGVSQANTQSTIFAALGGRLGLRWSVSRKLALRLHYDALVDLGPPEYQLAGASWSAPAFAYTVAGGVATSFP